MVTLPTKLTPAVRKALTVLQALALLGLVVFHIVEGLPDTPGQVKMNVALAMLLCLVSSFLLLGVRFGLAALIATYVLSWTAEEIGVRTGAIFGRYYYTDFLGAKLGNVPVMIPLYWYMLLYSAYVIAALIIKRGEAAGVGLFNRLWRSLLVACTVTNFDLVFDPYMSYKLKAWVWVGMNPGLGYFGVPFQNYYGWICTAFVLAMVLQWIHARIGTVPGGPRTMLTILAPVALYASYWVCYAWKGIPLPMRVIALIALGIPAIAGIAAWAGLSPKDAEEIAEEIF